MTGLELFLGMLMNVAVLGVGLAAICGLAALIFFMISAIGPEREWDYKSEDVIRLKQAWLNKAKSFGLLFLVFAFIACIPNVDQLWKIRISMIKLELSSPENVANAQVAIERIGRKLECKYIGGEGCKNGEIVEPTK